MSLVGVMSLCEMEKDLRASNEVLFGVAALEKRKDRDRDYVSRGKERIVSCF